MADAATEKSNIDMKNRGGAGRVEWLDALKGVLIILVAVGHFLLPIRKYFPDFAPITATYDLIYLFHMPLFVFVSGLLSKHAVDGNGRLNVNRIITYIAIAFAFNLATLLVDGTTIDWYHLTNMSGAAWYVMSLAAWTALVPLLKGLKPSVGMLLSVAVCVIASTQDAGTDLLSIGRTMHFMPYFAAGYYLNVADVERLRSGAPRVVAICAGVTSVAAYLAFNDAVSDAFFLVYGNGGCGMRLIDAVPALLGVSALGVGLSVACVSLVPGRCGLLAALGRRSFQVYVAHRLLRGVFASCGAYGALGSVDSGAVALGVLLAASAVSVAIGCLPPVTVAARRILGIRWRCEEAE